MALAEKVKTALGETRLLILGSQILFGFQLNAMFQEGFDDLGTKARLLDAAAFLLMTSAVGCLIAPSMQHQLVEQGHDSTRIQGVASVFAGIALFPFAVSLGIDFFVVLARQTGIVAAAGAAIVFFTLAMSFWFGIGLSLAKPGNSMSDKQERTPLHSRIEQMLTEARVVIPGAQALLGFQFAIMLTRAFGQLPDSSKWIHIAALCLVAVTVILVMAPAAIHRIGFNGEDTERFYEMGSRFVIAACAPLGLGIAADAYVAVTKAAGSDTVGLVCSVAILVLLFSLWFLQPLFLRKSLARSPN